MRRPLSVLLVAIFSCAFASSLEADQTFSRTFDFDRFPLENEVIVAGVFEESAINDEPIDLSGIAPDGLLRVDSIVVELSFPNPDDLVFQVRGPAGPSSQFGFTSFNLTFFGHGGDRNLGTGGNSGPNDLLTYTFVENAALTLSDDGTDVNDNDFYAAGTYAAVDWGSVPLDGEGLWTVFARTQNGASGAIGSLTINGTIVAVPEPGSFAIAGLLGGVLAVRRRRG